jgi:hypothetical protein
MVEPASIIKPKSIRELQPLDISGRHARKGFVYQDHVAVGFCIEFLTNPDLQEIWLESHDDIMLVKAHGESTFVEFVQVKAVDLPSRWSVPSICGNGNINDSIIKKLLDQDRCSEEVFFRIVSSFDVNDQISILKKNIGSFERNSEEEEEKLLAKLIIKKLGKEIKSPNGMTIDEFIKKCYWEKKADQINDLESSNKIELEKGLKDFGEPIWSDQRDEIYQKMLKLCQDASCDNINIFPDCYQIKRETFLYWLHETIKSLYTPSNNTQKLENKLRSAMNLPIDYVENAKQLRWHYTRKRLNNDFIAPTEITTMESIIHGELYTLKVALDNDEVSEENFHKICIDKLNDIKLRPIFRNKDIPDFLFQGYMYDLTSKCIHRFRKVEK